MFQNLAKILTIYCYVNKEFRRQESCMCPLLTPCLPFPFLEWYAKPHKIFLFSPHFSLLSLPLLSPPSAAPSSPTSLLPFHPPHTSIYRYSILYPIYYYQTFFCLIVYRLKDYDRNQNFTCSTPVILPQPLDVEWPVSGFSNLKEGHRLLLPKITREQTEAYFIFRLAGKNFFWQLWKTLSLFNLSLSVSLTHFISRRLVAC